LHVASPDAERLLTGLAPEASAELRAVVALRVDELIGYQDRAYAADYVRRVEDLRAAEALRADADAVGAAGSAPSEQLTLAVARNLHKLMAYKDEYEVARLAVDPEFAARVTEEWG